MYIIITEREITQKGEQKKFIPAGSRGKVEVMTVEEIKRICNESECESFGFRMDHKKYQTGEECEVSHQLFQDPWFDDDGELLYEEDTDPESPYYGFYDAGELDGTCSIGFDPDDPESIRKALEMVDIYPGEYFTVIGGTWGTGGNDIGENIISDAVVLYQEERRK